MRHLISIAAVSLATLWGSAAVADESPVVVELYTSQGCSSCPPADAMLAELATRDDVIALALHVDYWDYIGWADDLADPAFTQRQHDYARAAGSATVYTPQMIIGGVDHVIGSRPMDVAELIQLHRAKVAPVAVDLSRDGNALQIFATHTGQVTPMIVQLVQFTPNELRNISRGENAGQSISYHNVVHTLRVLARWDGSAALALETQIESDDPVAVLIQQGSNGPIVGAAQLR